MSAKSIFVDLKSNSAFLSNKGHNFCVGLWMAQSNVKKEDGWDMKSD